MRYSFVLMLSIAVFTWPVYGQSVASANEQLTKRLESLHPSRPLEYFELAEELADDFAAGGSPANLDIAKRLYALAAVIEPSRFGRSASLALAELATDAYEKRRLLSLAQVLGESRQERELSSSGHARPTHREEETTQTAALAMGEALSYFRRGLGSRALASLRTPGAMRLLERTAGVMGGANRILEDARAMRGSGRPITVSGADLAMMRIEVGLLAGSDRPWSADLALNRGETLIELNLERLDTELRVDGARTIYRNGIWVVPDR
ncbi:MAG TPA: hypothetical protein PK098_00070 [Phycisphaerales bacterium]|nr:hypothetical protein [Phycisphaerales bacterium]